MDYTYERTLPIPIRNYSAQHNCKELSLNHNLADPSKMSPPNIFMDKLIKRLDNYYFHLPEKQWKNQQNKCFIPRVHN